METETSKIKNVADGDNYYSITTESGCCFGMPKKYDITPKVGDMLTLHTRGSLIRGMDLNGIVVFYKTDSCLENERNEWLREHEEKKQKEFIKNKGKMDKQYSKLPQVFKDRIDRFRANNDRFRIDFESYELFCCEQAVEIANKCKTPEDVRAFAKKEWKDQRKQVQKLSDGHSGNTFGMACQLAYWFLNQPEYVTKMHGSLSTLVGSDEYGDIKK